VIAQLWEYLRSQVPETGFSLEPPWPRLNRAVGVARQDW
jgi:hypothetical protein